MTTSLLAFVVVSATVTAVPFTPKLVSRHDGLHHFEEQGLTVIRSTGDMTGDGVPEIVAGLKTLPFPGNDVSARVYSGADGSLVFTVPRPPSQLHSSPNPVAGLGDLDGDGLSEIIVGTPDVGVARIYSAAGALLGTLSPGQGGSFAKFGASVSPGGDTNLDGIQDILVGAPGFDRVYVYSGAPGLPTPFPLIATISGLDFQIAEASRFGASVAHYDLTVSRQEPSRIVVGAPLASNPDLPGAAGGHPGCVHVFALIDATGGGLLTPLHVFQSYGERSDFDLLGTDVDGGVDVNGDNFEDYLGSAMAADLPIPQGTGKSGPGYVTVYSGRNGIPLQTIESDQIGDLFGFSARFGGPCEGDSTPTTPTIIIGAPQARKVKPDGTAGNITGRVLVYPFGSPTPFVEIYGESKLSGMGVGVGGYVDVTGDGRAEFLAGSHVTNVGGLFGVGSIYVLSCVDIPRPLIEIQPQPLLFPSTPVGQATGSNITVSNVGTADLIVQSLEFTAATSSAFSFADGGTAPFTISPGNDKLVSVNFQPGTAGLHGGQIQVLSNADCDPIVLVTLGGTSPLKKIEVTPGSVNFGSVEVGDNEGEVLSVKNVGTDVLTVSEISLVAGDFSIGFLPSFPKVLAPNEAFLFLAFFQPTAAGGVGASIQVSSDDPASPVLQVPLTATGIQPNPAPTAVIKLLPPYYNSSTPQAFVGFVDATAKESFDTPPFPGGQVLSYRWFRDGVETFTDEEVLMPVPAGTPPAVSVIGLEVTDDGGKSDSTSVSAIAADEVKVRSRFYGRITQGGFDVPAGTVVEAWINNVRVASSLTQVHHGESVYAIETPPNGRTDGDTVEFRYELVTANETGIWYSAADQEIDLTAPFYIPPINIVDLDWCILLQILGLRICGPPPLAGIEIRLIPIPIPDVDPGPLRIVGQPFELSFFRGVGGPPITQFRENYSISTRYLDSQLEAAGVTDESSLNLHVLDGSSWRPAGVTALDVEANEVVTSLNHASTFALLGSGGTEPPDRAFRRSDANADGATDISDAITVLNYLFVNRDTVLPCSDTADSNDDGALDISDAIYVLEYVFLGGDLPPAPGPDACGVDPTEDELRCESFEPCL